MNVELGTIFRWSGFPFARYGEKDKPRWFICVGFSGAYSQAREFFLCTTTTSLDSFQNPRLRKGHRHFIFKVSQYPCFDEDCAVDFDEKPYVVSEKTLLSHQVAIEIKGKIDETTMRMIYKSLLQSSHLSSMELTDIHNSYNMAGITGLKKPRSKK